MPINPQIVSAQLPGIQVENPLNIAKNVLAIRQAQSEIAANELAAQRAARLNALVSQNNLTPQALMAAGFFPEAEKMSGALKESRLASEAEFKAIDAAMNTSSRLLDTVRTPEDMIAWHEANHANPVLGPYLAARGITAEQSRAKIMTTANDPEAFQQLLLDSRLGLEKSRKQHFIEQEYGGGTRVLGMGEYGGPARVVPGSDIAVTPSPNRPVTVFDMSKKFRDTLGEKAALRLDAYRESAEQAARGIETNARLRPLLNDPKFISGTFAEARTAVAKAAGIDVSATEAFLSGMAEQVAARIKAFGAGTGLSNADRDYALAWAGGKPDLSTKGIARIMRINDESGDAVIEKYNNERNFLAKKEPEIVDYYPEVGARGVAVGTIKPDTKTGQNYRFKGGDPANPKNWEKVGK